MLPSSLTVAHCCILTVASHFTIAIPSLRPHCQVILTASRVIFFLIVVKHKIRRLTVFAWTQQWREAYARSCATNLSLVFHVAKLKPSTTEQLPLPLSPPHQPLAISTLLSKSLTTLDTSPKWACTAFVFLLLAYFT